MIKERNIFLSTYLVFAILVNGLTAIAYIFFPEKIQALDPTVAPWLLYSLAAISCANVIFLIALMKWKKWGFWGNCATTILTFFINLTWQKSGMTSLLGLLGPVILFALLQYGKEKNAWLQLE